jgi:hypothetical protein
MGKTYEFLSKWTKIDNVLSIYSQRIFERVVTKYNLGRRGSLGIGCVSSFTAAVFVICAAVMSGLLGKQLYLETYGIDAQATIITQSTHMTADRRSRHTQWRDIEYEFTTRDGQHIVSNISRPVEELTSIPPHQNRFAIAYWDQFPSVNLPHGVRFKALELIAMALFFAVCALHFIVLAWRFFGWRRRILSSSETAGARQHP